MNCLLLSSYAFYAVAAADATDEREKPAKTCGFRRRLFAAADRDSIAYLHGLGRGSEILSCTMQRSRKSELQAESRCAMISDLQTWQPLLISLECL